MTAKSNMKYSKCPLYFHRSHLTECICDKSACDYSHLSVEFEHNLTYLKLLSKHKQTARVSSDASTGLPTERNSQNLHIVALI